MFLFCQLLVTCSSDKNGDSPTLKLNFKFEIFQSLAALELLYKCCYSSIKITEQINPFIVFVWSQLDGGKVEQKNIKREAFYKWVRLVSNNYCYPALCYLNSDKVFLLLNDRYRNPERDSIHWVHQCTIYWMRKWRLYTPSHHGFYIIHLYKNA